MKYRDLNITTPELAIAVADNDIPVKITRQVLVGTIGSRMTVIEFDDEIAPGGSMCYYNSVMGTLKLLTLMISLPSLGIRIELENDDVSYFLDTLRMRTIDVKV